MTTTYAITIEQAKERKYPLRVCPWYDIYKGALPVKFGLEARIAPRRWVYVAKNGELLTRKTKAAIEKIMVAGGEGE